MNNAHDQAITKGLKSIYLHNSYIRNKRVKLQCDGHTNLIGGNGRGKTSMLNLLPVFAGISPERMVQKVGDKSSFLDFYLPNLQSMIVYEYVGHQGICCVVMYRHQSGTKLIYRFVQGSAVTTFFAPQFNDLFEKNAQASEIINELQSQQIKVSKQIDTVLDYRAVLHNDKDRFTHDKSLRHLAMEFAMCGRQFTLRHLGELTRVPMSQTNLIDKFKSMLVDAYLADESAVVGDKGLTHTENLTLIEDIKSLREFIKESSQLAKGAQLRQDVVQTLKQLVKVKWQGDRLTEQLDVGEEKLKQDHGVYLQQYELTSSTLQSEVTELSTQHSDKQGKRKSVNKKLEHINQQEQEYLTQDIQHLIREYAELPRYQTQHQENEAHLQRLQASAEVLLNSHEKHVQQIKVKADQDTKIEQQKKANVNHQQVELRDQQFAEVDSLSVSHQEEFKNLQTKQDLALQTTNENIQQASRSMGAAAALTVDEQQRIDLNKKLLKEQKLQITEHQNKHRIVQQKVTDQTKKVAQALAEFEKNKALLSKERTEESKLREQMNNEGTLISFLRGQANEDWKQHIGKLINPALLLKKGLKPTWDLDELNQNSFYGLHLETDHISLPQEAETLDELRNRIERQILRCEQIQSDQTTLERHADTAQQELEVAKIEKITSDQQLKGLNDKFEELEAVQENTEIQIRINVNERKENAAKLLQDAEQQHKHLSQQHKDAKENLQRHQQQARDEVKAKYQQLDQQLQEELKRIDQAVKQVSKHCAEKIAELIEARDHALKAEGLDTGQLTSAEQRVVTSQQRVETVSGYIVIINAYHEWVKVELSQRDDLQHQLGALQNDIENLDQACKAKVNELEKLDEDKAKNNKQYEAAITAIHGQLLNVKRLLNRLLDPLSEFSGLDEMLNIVEPEMPLDFDWYINNGQTQLAQLEQLRKESLQLYQMVKQILSLAQGNGLEKYWSNHMVDSPHRVDSLPYVLQAMSVLSQMLKHEIPSKIEATITAYQSLGIVFRNHYDSLKRFQRKVARVSDDLSSNINAHNPFAALSEIEVRLEATINKFGYLTDLENFVNKFEADVHELPNENVEASLSGAVKALHNSNAESHDLKSMVEMSIRFKENGRLVRVKNDRDLAEASSTGLSRLVILLIFTGLIRHLCTDESVAIHLPIDELGQIDAGNSIKLLELMKQQQVHLVCAQPQMAEEIGKSFANKYNIDKDKGVSQFVVKSKIQQNPLLVAGGNA